jgi:hypothetical protein
MRRNPEHFRNFIEHFDAWRSLAAFDQTQVTGTDTQFTCELSFRQSMSGSDDADRSTEIHDLRMSPKL